MTAAVPGGQGKAKWAKEGSAGNLGEGEIEWLGTHAVCLV